MVSKVEKFQDLQNATRCSAKYLFFDNLLLIQESPYEDHTDIFTASGKQKSEVQVAGGLSVLKNEVAVDGHGSSRLEIGPRDPAPLIEFIKKLPGSKRKKVIKVS